MTTSAPESAPVYPQAPTGLRRPGIIAVVVTAIVIGVTIWLGHPLVGVFFLWAWWASSSTRSPCATSWRDRGRGQPAQEVFGPQFRGPARRHHGAGAGGGLPGPARWAGRYVRTRGWTGDPGTQLGDPGDEKDCVSSCERNLHFGGFHRSWSPPRGRVARDDLQRRHHHRPGARRGDRDRPAFFVKAKMTSGKPNTVQIYFETITVQMRQQIEQGIGMKIAVFRPAAGGPQLARQCTRTGKCH